MSVRSTDLRKNQFLTNMSVKYRNPMFFWRMVTPPVIVSFKSDDYPVYTKEDLFVITDSDLFGETSRVNEISWTLSPQPYNCIDRGFGSFVTKMAEQHAAMPINAMMTTNDFVNQRVELMQEKRVADIVMDKSNYPTANVKTLSGDQQWTDPVNSDPVGDLLDIMNRCFYPPNVIVIPPDTWVVFASHPKVLSTARGQVVGGLVTTEMAANMLNAKRVVVPSTRHTPEKRGASTRTYPRTWGKHVVAHYVEDEPTIDSVCWSKTFQHLDKMTLTAFDSRRGRGGSTFVQVDWGIDIQVIASDVGAMIEDPIP